MSKTFSKTGGHTKVKVTSLSYSLLIAQRRRRDVHKPIKIMQTKHLSMAKKIFLGNHLLKQYINSSKMNQPNECTLQLSLIIPFDFSRRMHHKNTQKNVMASRLCAAQLAVYLGIFHQ